MLTTTMYAVKIYHSQRVETVNSEDFDYIDGIVQEMGERNIKTKAYELRDGKTLDMYTEEEIDADTVESADWLQGQTRHVRDWMLPRWDIINPSGIAKRIGVSQPMLSMFARGKNGMSSSNLQALIGVLEQLGYTKS